MENVMKLLDFLNNFCSSKQDGVCLCKSKNCPNYNNCSIDIWENAYKELEKAKLKEELNYDK